MNGLATDLVGQVVANRYRVESVIGRGGQGVVYRAHVSEGESVAIKVLADALARDPQAAGRFLREQAALQALAGTSAVKVFDAGQLDDGSLYLVLELLEGRDLEQELAELEAQAQRMPLQRIGQIIAPVAETLDAAHEKGILHRDLKPANLFLTQDSGVRLLDFGFARLRASQPLTAMGMVMGSPSYIAPEVWKGRPELVDHRVDIYSLAVILFRMLSGELPFQGSSLADVFMQATTAERPSLHRLRPGLPPAVDQWALRALAIDREARFGSARECLSELFVSLGSEQVLVALEAPGNGALGELRAAAAQHFAAVLQGAAAALKRWATRGEPDAEPPAPAAPDPSPEPSRPRPSEREARVFPVIPKLAPAGSSPPQKLAGSSNRARRLVSPPPRTKSTATAQPRQYPKVPALSPQRGVLPPPPSFTNPKGKR